MTAIGEITRSEGLVKWAYRSQLRKSTIVVRRLEGVLSARVEADQQHITKRHGVPLDDGR